MVHQLPVGRNHRTGQNDGCQGNKGGDFPQGNTTRPLTDGKPNGKEAGAFDYGGCGAKPRLNLKVPLRLRREQI